MKNRLGRLLKSDNGFTLIELLIAVVILGILATIAVVAVTGARANAITAACREAATTQIKALDQYYIDNGAFPTPVNGGYDGTDFLQPKYLHKMSPQVNSGASEKKSDTFYLKTVIADGNTQVIGYTTSTGGTLLNPACSIP